MAEVCRSFSTLQRIHDLNWKYCNSLQRGQVEYPLISRIALSDIARAVHIIGVAIIHIVPFIYGIVGFAYGMGVPAGQIGTEILNVFQSLLMQPEEAAQYYAIHPEANPTVAGVLLTFIPPIVAYCVATLEVNVLQNFRDRITHINECIIGAIEITIAAVAMRVTTLAMTVFAIGEVTLCCGYNMYSIAKQQHFRVKEVVIAEAAFIKNLTLGFMGALSAIFIPEITFREEGINCGRNMRWRLTDFAFRYGFANEVVIDRLIEGEASVENLKVIFDRLNSYNPAPAWFSASLKVTFLKKVLRAEGYNRAFLESIIASMDNEALKLYHAQTKKSILVAAIDKGLNEETLERLLQRPFLYAQKCDNRGTYVLERLITTTQLYETPGFLGFADKLGIELTIQGQGASIQIDVSGKPSGIVLWKYLRGQNIGEIQRYFSSLSGSEKMEFLRQVEMLFGKDLVASLAGMMVQVDREHMKREVAQVNIPNKNPGIRIQELSTLYADTTRSYDAWTFSHLQTLENNITNNNEILGAEDAFARAAMYGTVDNALCNVIEWFKDKITRLEARERGKKIRDLAQAGSREAIDLLGTMDIFFNEVQEAAIFCAPRLYTTVLQSYQLIVLGENLENESLEMKVLTGLAAQRDIIARTLFTSEQSVHKYNPFLREFGKELGLPGYQALAGFRDRFAAHVNRDDLEPFSQQFLAAYTPAVLIETVKATVEKNREIKNLFVEVLRQNVPQGFGKAFKAHICTEVQRMWDDINIPREQRKRAINTFLASEPFFITLDDNDLSSIQNIKATITEMPEYQDWRLYIAACTDGTGFTRTAIISYLMQVGILKT